MSYARRRKLRLGLLKVEKKRQTEGDFVTRTRSECLQLVGGVEIEMSAELPQSDVVAFHVNRIGRVDVSPLIEGDLAPLIRTNRY